MQQMQPEITEMQPEPTAMQPELTAMWTEIMEMQPEITEKQPQIMSKGGSVIIGPNGRVISGPLIDEAGILYAELDLADLPRNRFDFDVVGHYARPDVFRLLINKKESIREEKENLFQN